MIKIGDIVGDYALSGFPTAYSVFMYTVRGCTPGVVCPALVESSHWTIGELIKACSDKHGDDSSFVFEDLTGSVQP